MYKRSKYSKEQTQVMKVAIIEALTNPPTEEFLSFDDIRARSFELKGATTQKMSRILSEMAEVGFVTKGSKDKKVAYKANATMIV